MRDDGATDVRGRPGPLPLRGLAAPSPLLAWCAGPTHVQQDIRRPSEGLLARYILKLYITGASPRAHFAIENLRRICDEELAGEYDLDVIDVLERPEVAEEDRILATPTLIKQLPPPLRRVIGDLSDKQKVLLGLELRAVSNPPSPGRDTA